MPNIAPFIRVKYWGLRPSPELERAIADASESLGPHRATIESCELHVGRWVQHHDQGYSYRLSLNIEHRGSMLSLEDETDLNASVEARDQMLRKAFARAASRLASK